LWEPYLSKAIDFRPKAALLVCLSPSGLRNSKAIVGFSACGPRRIKDQIIHDRKEHLQVLKQIPTYNLQWPVGNCAEDDAFAHLMMLEKCFPVLNQAGPGMLAVSLTVDLKDLGPVQPCDQCRDLIRKVRSRLTVTANLAPVGIARTN
jgi:hypothetical protein